MCLCITRLIFAILAILVRIPWKIKKTPSQDSSVGHQYYSGSSVVDDSLFIVGSTVCGDVLCPLFVIQYLVSINRFFNICYCLGIK